MIAILGAMDREVRGLIDRMQDKAEHATGSVAIVEGTMCGQRIAVAKCGIGKVNAAIAAQTMILQCKPTLVINTGVGGSLGGGFGLLDIGVGTSAVQHDMDNSALGDPVGFTPGVEKVEIPLDARYSDELLSAVFRAGLKGGKAKIASGDRFISDPAEKSRLRALFGADICEEEGAAVAQACFLAGVPCAVLRAVSDATDGEHGMEYRQFADIAADNALKVIAEFLRGL